MDKGYSIGATNQPIKENSIIIIFTGRVSTYGMIADNMKASGNRM
jgi:hypothetical protein